MYLVRSSKVVRLACSPVSGCRWPPTSDRVSRGRSPAVGGGVLIGNFPTVQFPIRLHHIPQIEESIEHGRLRLRLQKGILSSMSIKASAPVNQPTRSVSGASAVGEFFSSLGELGWLAGTGLAGIILSSGGARAERACRLEGFISRRQVSWGSSLFRGGTVQQLLLQYCREQRYVLSRS